MLCWWFWFVGEMFDIFFGRLIVIIVKFSLFFKFSMGNIDILYFIKNIVFSNMFIVFNVRGNRFFFGLDKFFFEEIYD